jgi:DNA-binding PadR family transcriptional regulator
MSKRLPPIPHLLFLGLPARAAGERTGRDLRALLADYGVRNSAPAFYQMMARLEDGAFVEGAYVSRVINGQHLKERHYELTAAGKRALSATRTFYANRLAASRRERKGAHA